ncbi:ABC transporter permease [Spirosoma oryzicola]|uniref:ABC transporter permease n=1 Tax=Spirosoma oryzicola TaxID=2898794 RepID=UPI001E5B0012|nr:ABC transporter permease [Spirosoma oryzicola]UHG92164.1 ABC transporter permease [Spirosoma oryzicola]
MKPDQSQKPPLSKWVDKLLGWLVAPHLREEVLGDIHERYARRVQRLGERKARLTYWREVLAYARPSFITRKPSPYSTPSYTDMLRNYLKIAFRNLIKQKGYSFINIAGLSVGMAVAMLIGLWIHHEYSYDKFLPDYQQLYQVRRNFNSNGDTLTFTTTSLKLADALRYQIPEVEQVAESDHMGSHGLKVGDKKIYLNGAQIGGDFLQMFQYPLVEGKASLALKDPYSIVLTESTAKALFGSENPMGKIVRFDNQNDLKVTGILKDLPTNSSLQFNYLVPFSYYEATVNNVRMDRSGSFGNNGYQIFVKLKPGASYAQVSNKIALIQHTERNNSNAMNSVVILQPLQNWHLYSTYQNGKETGGFIEYIRMFSVIGILVVLIACINFVNLTTARSARRAKEVGVRKSVGSQRQQLIGQFLIESFLLTVVAFLFSLLLMQILLPAFNSLTESQIAIPYTTAGFWMAVLGCLLITALLAGSLPAFYLSSFQPVKVLKGTMQVGKAASLPRKVLVVAQFSCSIALILSAIIVFKQIQHAKNRPTGYDVNRLLMTNMNLELSQNFTVLKDELIKNGIAEQVSQSSSPATDIWWHSDLDKWPGKNAGETVELGVILVAKDYFKTVGMTLAQGRDFSGENDTTSVIFNEAAIKRFRLPNPIGQLITWQGKPLRIVGVAKNALMQSPFTKADPTMFVCTSFPLNVLLYRISPRLTTQEALSKMTALFNTYNPSYAYSYQFADESYAAKFKQESLIGKLAGIFAGLAIFISCLGLFGLASFMAERRTKEIGVRKVLGASILNVWGLLSKEFVYLVGIAFLIATPVAYYLLSNWLQKYEYRTEMSWWIFALTGLGAMVVTLLTVSFQSIKAALLNPVKSLKME